MSDLPPRSDRANPVRFQPDPAALLERMETWARADPGVSALVLLGSRARTDRPADAWSDTDLIIVLDDPRRVLDEVAWPSRFGPVAITFVEETVGGRRERRTLFDDGTDLDVVPLSTDGLRRSLEDPHALGVLARGHRVLVDKGGLLTDLASRLERLATLGAHASPAWPPEPTTFGNLVSDFWYHALWSARKLRRGERWTAQSAIDGRMKWQLLAVIEWRARSHRGGVDPWFSGRFLERWADPEVLAELAACFAHYDDEDLTRALLATMGLFRRLAQEVALQQSLPYPAHADQAATSLVSELLAASSREPGWSGS